MHSLADDARHLLQVLVAGRLAVGSALPHDVDPDRGMRNVAADIHVVLAAGQDIKVLGIGLPGLWQAFHQYRVRDILDAFHQPDQQFVLVRSARCETDAAVAHHHRRHAMVRRRYQAIFPGRLPILMGVDVDEAGRHYLPGGIDFVACALDPLADVDYPTGGDPDIRLERRNARSIDHRATPVSQFDFLYHRQTSFNALCIRARTFGERLGSKKKLPFTVNLPSCGW